MRPGMPTSQSPALAALGANIKARRVAAGWSQEEFAVRLVESGKSADGAYVSRIESGSINPTAETIFDFARALGIRPAELLDGIE